MNGYSILFLIGVFVSAISQVMLKKSALKQYDNHIREYINPLVIIAYVLFVGTTILSTIAFKGISLSMGAVLESSSYIFVTFFGVKIFHESINRKKVVSLVLIVTGIMVYSFLG